MPTFTNEEKELLARFVTSAEDDVFAIKNLNGIVGAVYARYSRAKGSFRETLLKEFVKEGVLDPKKAEELISRVLVAFGDDSVGELEGAHVSFERISMVATKEIEDRRIGGSPIEQSTRYVTYDRKDDAGQWLYYRGKECTDASFGKQYIETMDHIFETYARLIEPMKEYFKLIKPMEAAEYDINGDGKKERLADCTEEKDVKAFTTTYAMDVRTKACDTLRHLLPLATLTNVGMFGNGRFFQGLISHLKTADLPEAQEIGKKTLAACSDVIPQYVKRASRSEYRVAVRLAMTAVAGDLNLGDHGEIPQVLPSVALHEPLSGKKYDTGLVAAMLYPYASVSFAVLMERVRGMTKKQRMRVVQAYVGERQTRRDRPGRAFEYGYPLTFDLVTDWGTYKDLMRHRANTQQRQVWTAGMGFFMAPELIEAGFENDVKECVEKSRELYEMMRSENPELAQYAVMHGNYVRWMLGMNDREAFHMLELRTVPQGHPNYRRVAQLMHTCIAERSPWRADSMKFVDYNDYYWSRADSEARQRVKERQWEERAASLQA